MALSIIQKERRQNISTNLFFSVGCGGVVQFAQKKICPLYRAYHLCKLHNDIFHHSFVAASEQKSDNCPGRITSYQEIV